MHVTLLLCPHWLNRVCVCVCVQDARRMLEEVEEELPYDRGVLNFPIKNLKKRWV